jgi:hypothetical protein
MNRKMLTTIAPHVFRKRLLVEGFFTTTIDESALRRYFAHVTSTLDLRTYGDPVIHSTSGQGKPQNEGYDGFVPLIDSGIYIAVWMTPRFFSTILYTCAEFNEDIATHVICDFLGATERQAAIF